MERRPPLPDWHPPREAAPPASPRWRELPSRDEGAVRQTVASVRPAGVGPGCSPSPWPAGQTGRVFDPMAAPPMMEAELTPGGQFFAALRRQPTAPEGAFDRRPAAIPGAAAEELDELAAKLQRILEEQARRHGIDV